MHLSPHWGPEDPGGFQLRLCVCMSVSLYICLSICSPALIFVDHKSATRNFTQFMRPSVRPYVRPVAHGPFAVNFICIDFQCGGPASQCIYPHTGVQRIPVGLIQAYTSFYISACLVVRIFFWWSKGAACNCAHRMRPQAMGSNPLSGSIICPSVRPSVRQYIRPYVCPSVWKFFRPSICMSVWPYICLLICTFVCVPFVIFICINFPVWGSSGVMHTMGSRVTQLGPVDIICTSVYLSICISVYLSVFMSLCLSVCMYLYLYVSMSGRPRHFLAIKSCGP